MFHRQPTMIFLTPYFFQNTQRQEVLSNFKSIVRETGHISSVESDQESIPSSDSSLYSSHYAYIYPSRLL